MRGVPLASLDISPLLNSTERLREGYAEHLASPDHELLRDGLIQRFEFTFEVAVKTLRRYVQSVIETSDAPRLKEFEVLVRTANQLDLLKGQYADWHGYRNLRNLASHEYVELKAMTIVDGVPKFLDELDHLIQVLRQRLYL